MLGFKGRASLSSRSKIVLDEFVKERPEAKKLLVKSKGVLVFPSVIKAGMGFGAEYGEGTLFKNGKEEAFYNLISVSFGWQLGAQLRTIIMFFMEESAVQHFEQTAGWKIGVDASVAVITLDIGVQLDTNELTSPVIAIVTDRKGLMYNLSLEGSKISRIG